MTAVCFGRPSAEMSCSNVPSSHSISQTRPQTRDMLAGSFELGYFRFHEITLYRKNIFIWTQMDTELFFGVRSYSEYSSNVNSWLNMLIFNRVQADLAKVYESSWISYSSTIAALKNVNNTNCYECLLQTLYSY